MKTKTHSTLPNGAFFIIGAVFLDLVVLVCVMTMMTTRIGMPFGYRVKAPASDLVMNADGEMVMISVTAGESPAFYMDNQVIEGGIRGVETRLESLSLNAKKQGGKRLNIGLRLDASVSRGLEQALVNLVLEKGLNCYIITEPDLSHQ